MIYSSEADIVSFLKGLVQSLVPYAQANDVHITFSTVVKKQAVLYQPFMLSQSLVRLICNMINLLPPKSQIKVRLSYNADNQNIKIDVINTGIDLIRVNEVTVNSGYAFTGHSFMTGTIYTLILPGTAQPAHPLELIHITTSPENIPSFYKEIQKRLHAHFSLTERLFASLEHSSPREAAFLQKINTLITVNLGNEQFDTSALCRAMFMSRTQLFRRLKSLIRQAPANYIKTIRLHKARELLVTSDLTVSQVAYRTGFQTISHFTKIFKNQYGVPPSVYRGSIKPATNE